MIFYLFTEKYFAKSPSFPCVCCLREREKLRVQEMKTNNHVLSNQISRPGFNSASERRIELYPRPQYVFMNLQ